MKGEYTGADGRTYRWRKYREFYVRDYRGEDGLWYEQCGVMAADIDAAFAALKELQEEEEYSGVTIGEVRGGYPGFQLRQRRTGEWELWYQDPECGWQHEDDDAEHDLTVVVELALAGLAQGRNQAQALAQAVLETTPWLSGDGTKYPCVVDWNRIVALAKEVVPCSR